MTSCEPPPYDPWQHLRTDWPEIAVAFRPLPDDLLGVVRYPVIVLRAGSTPAQHRCTLAHEIVHLERGVPHGDDAGVAGWLAREEARVERTAARRLISVPRLARAARDLGAGASAGALAAALDVDTQLLRVRLDDLDSHERIRLLALCHDDDRAA